MQKKKIKLTQEGLKVHGQYFAITTNNEAWRMSEKTLTDKDKEVMLEKAFASLYHWRANGTPYNVHMAYLIIARALCVNGAGELALQYAEKAQNHFGEKGEKWVQAFCQMMVANAWAVQGKKRNFKKHYDLAVAMAADLEEKEQKVFNATLAKIEAPA